MKKRSFYLKFNFWSIFSIFMLFVLGGLVRATGSGMGCPDWPKCFGEYIPPTSAAELPDNYKEIFTAERLKKAERFAALLHKLGMEEEAQQILSYEAIEEAHDFSAAKAYTEYFNRLWGATTGIIVLLTLIFSFSYIRTDFLVFVFTSLGFLAVMFNALLGAVVVAANLWGNLVSWHFIAAFAAVGFFMIARFRISKPQYDIELPRSVKLRMGLLLLMIGAQMIIGTQVREAYDAMESMGKELTIDNVVLLGKHFNWHRTLAVILLLFTLGQFRNLKKWNHPLQKQARYVLIIIVAQIVFGSLIVMTDWSALSKLFHISIGAALFIVQFYICSPLLKGKPQIENS